MNRKISKFITTFMAVLFTLATITAQEKTMYVMKKGVVDFSIAVSSVDSIIFYNPVPAVIPVTGVNLDKTTHTLNTGENFKLTATVVPSNATDKTVTWSSSNSSVASVDNTGKVTAGNTTGTANITATSNANTSAKGTCAVTVTAPSSATLTLTASPSATFKLTDCNNTGSHTVLVTSNGTNVMRQDCDFSSSDASVSDVSAYGTIRAYKVGTAVITAILARYTNGTSSTIPLGTKGTITLTVTDGGAVTSTPLKLVIGEGSTPPYTPHITGSVATGKTLYLGIDANNGVGTADYISRLSCTLSSSNASVASINESGTISTLSAGTTTIKAVRNTGGAGEGTITLTVTGTPATDPFDKQITGPQVAYSDGGTAAMTNPFFWVRFAQDKGINTDAEILTASEIASFNTSSATTTLRITLPSSLANETTVTHSQLTTLASTYGYTSKGSGFTAYVPSFSGNRDVRLGIVTSFAQMTTTPSAVVLGSSGNCETGLEVSEGVVIYADYGNYYLVKSQNYFGWVLQSTVATCPKESFLNYANPTSFVIVTAERLQTSLGVPTMLRMGTKLPIASIDGNNITFRVPVRLTSGGLSSQTVTLAADGNNEYIHVGYLTYNTKNLLKQMFKMLGQNYGWGDGNADRDCSSTVWTAYKCCGFILPRNTTQMEAIPAGTYCKSVSGNTNIMNVLSGYRPGSILLKSGHVVMYLGYYNGAHYIIHNSGSPRSSCKVTGLSIYDGLLTYLKSLQK